MRWLLVLFILVMGCPSPKAEGDDPSTARCFATTGTGVLNPRRPNWDPTWTQGSPQLREQIEWELRGLEHATLIPMYFAQCRTHDLLMRWQRRGQG